MTDPFAPDVEPDFSHLDRVHSDAAKDWQRRRTAERRMSEIQTDTMRQSYETIVFPDAAGCRRAALVVCSRAKDVADAKVILEALALPKIMREGGDGRSVRVQRGPLPKSMIRTDPKPLGYGPDDFGRPDAKPKRKGR